MPSGFVPLLRAQWRLLRREPGYWIAGVGLAAIVIIIYGSVLTSPNSPELGAVTEDDSPTLREALDELAGIEGIDLHVGDLDEEMAALEEGERWAVIVFPPGTIESAREGRAVTARVIYNDASPFEATAGQGILREFVSELNATIGATSELAVEEQVVEGQRGIGLLDTLFPGLVGMALMLGNSLAASTFVAWREAGVLKRIRSSPVRPLALQGSQFLTLMVVSAIQVTVLVVLAQVLFGVSVAGSYAMLAAVAFAGAIAFIGIWYALAALLTNATSFFAIMNLASFLMIFLGGSVVPNDNVPSWLEPVVQAMPLTHLNDALRAVINEAAGPREVAGDGVILAAWAVAGFAISSRLFRWSAE